MGKIFFTVSGDKLTFSNKSGGSFSLKLTTVNPNRVALILQRKHLLEVLEKILIQKLQDS